MKVLVIDDIRVLRTVEQAGHDVTYVRNEVDAFKVDPTDYDVVFWDHDLGGTQTTRSVALALAERAFNARRLNLWTIERYTGNVHIVITSNPAGADWISATLKRHGMQVWVDSANPYMFGAVEDLPIFVKPEEG